MSGHRLVRKLLSPTEPARSNRPALSGSRPAGFLIVSHAAITGQGQSTGVARTADSEARTSRSRSCLCGATREDLSERAWCGNNPLAPQAIRFPCLLDEHNPSSTPLRGFHMPIDLAHNDTFTTLSAMIAPAIFLTANASLIISTSNRVSRVVDRIRVLVDLADKIGRGASDLDFPAERMEHVHRQLEHLQWRSDRLRAAMTALYLAFSSFVGTSLTLAIDDWLKNRLGSLPTLLAIAGVGLMLFASINLVRECFSAWRQPPGHSVLRSAQCPAAGGRAIADVKRHMSSNRPAVTSVPRTRRLREGTRATRRLRKGPSAFRDCDMPLTTT